MVWMMQNNAIYIITNILNLNSSAMGGCLLFCDFHVLLGATRDARICIYCPKCFIDCGLRCRAVPVIRVMEPVVRFMMHDVV